MTDHNEQIWEECDKIGLLYDKSNPPTKVSPDCYLLYGTICQPYGACRRKRYYAVTGGSKIEIYEN